MNKIALVLDWLWNLKALKGKRTLVAQIGLGITAAMVAYQGIATDPEWIAKGVDLKDLPSSVLVWAGGISIYLARKVKQFAQEHKG